MAEGLQVSKANLYAVVATPAGTSVSKAQAYAVLSTEDLLNVSKAVAYAVLVEAAPEPEPSAAPPVLLIIT